MGRDVAFAIPWPSDTISGTTKSCVPESTPLTTTVAPGMTAPLGSFTITRSAPVCRACAVAIRPPGSRSAIASSASRISVVRMGLALPGEALGVDLGVDLHLADRPFLVRRATARAADFEREFDAVNVTPLLEVKGVIHQLGRLLLHLLDLFFEVRLHLLALFLIRRPLHRHRVRAAGGGRDAH